MVPKNKKKWDYVNMHSFQLVDELWFQKMVGKEVFLIKTNHQFYNSNEEYKFLVPNHEKKGYYYVNLYLSQLTDELWF